MSKIISLYNEIQNLIKSQSKKTTLSTLDYQYLDEKFGPIIDSLIILADIFKSGIAAAKNIYSIYYDSVNLMLDNLERKKYGISISSLSPQIGKESVIKYKSEKEKAKQDELEKLRLLKEKEKADKEAENKIKYDKEVQRLIDEQKSLSESEIYTNSKQIIDFYYDRLKTILDNFNKDYFKFYQKIQDVDNTLDPGEYVIQTRPIFINFKSYCKKVSANISNLIFELQRFNYKVLLIKDFHPIFKFIFEDSILFRKYVNNAMFGRFEGKDEDEFDIINNVDAFADFPPDFLDRYNL
jgi:hypothetical protein